ncbi:MAG: hypothetical protein A7315_01725 [Candidatus Altiarchaeales archaeon WOR_SM1_79]|jgi:hypothetical protein|nr:MAG: hypothetical protein A7315_01725 [Candidatus Altiarchaeales archaeon WOR_SM1_79]
MRGKGFVIALVLVPLIYLLFVRPLLISEEARIRRAVKEGVQAIEAEDLGKCLRHVSLHYKDEYGLTYVGVKGLLTRIFQDFEGFEIDFRNLGITFLDEEVASVTFGLKVKVSYGGQRVYLLGSGDFSNRIKLSLIKEGGRWKVTQVEGVEAHGIGQGLPKVVRRCLDNTV